MPFSLKKNIQSPQALERPVEAEAEDQLALNPEKSTWQKVFPVMAAGSGLFSDGYLNNVCHNTHAV